MEILGIIICLLLVGTVFSNQAESDILTWLLRPSVAAPTRPTAIEVALFDGDPGETGAGGTEVTGADGLTRQAWTGAAPTIGDPTTIANANAIEFGDPSADGQATHVAWYDVGTGNFLGRGTIAGGPVAYQAAINDPLSFPIGALVVELD